MRVVQIRDSEVLSKFPRAVRRRVLRALYLPRLQGAYLLASQRIRSKPNFLLTMLDLGTVDMYVPGVAVVEANARVNDFLILLDGEMRVRPYATSAAARPVALTVLSRGIALPAYLFLPFNLISFATRCSRMPSADFRFAGCDLVMCMC